MQIIFFLCMQTWSVYLDSSLSFIGLTKGDITFRSDYVVADAYRFSIIDTLLSSPLNSLEFLLSLDEKFSKCRIENLMEELMTLYDLEITDKKGGLMECLDKSYDLVKHSLTTTPHELDSVYRQLMLFSPQPTGSIEEEKEHEKKYDSLINYLKENGQKMQYEELFNAGLALLVALEDYQILIDSGTIVQNVSGVDGGILYYKKFDFGEIIIGDTGKNVYKRDFAIIIDLGGDDVYQLDEQAGYIHMLIDKSGNDVYAGENYAIACGRFGVSILVDEQGDDRYQAESFSIGCGIFGVGILIDRDGDDQYFGDTFTQGAGGFGIGILRDEKGNDVYEGALYAQGFASTHGVGIISDCEGNDAYVILKKYLDEIRYLDHYLSLSQGFSIGFRPDLSAGIGLILDGGGNDYYIADIFAQGSSYWYGLGAIIDRCGNDDYVAFQYAQGAGTHITIGLLIDKSGDDNYVSKGVSQGCGHDLSLGLLYDIEGDDSYAAFDLSQGAGNANGVGILLDEKGDDSYTIKRTHNTQGYGDFRREYGSVGILLDIEGRDFYPLSRDKSILQKGEYGISIDWQ